jgi:histidyl-tRNA synthetase
MKIRNHIFSIVRSCFEKYGGIEIDTPVIENFTVITELYGDEFNKLVYKLESDELFLRYDLTLPFARYVNMNNLKQFRRYQISKVYRKDNPQISRGRYREFYQCDFDILYNDKNNRLAEFEIIDLFDFVMSKLLGEKYFIRYNDRRFINELLTYSGISEKDFLNIYSILDKLGKKDINEIEAELKTRGFPTEKLMKIYNDLTSDIDKIEYFRNLGFSSIKYISDIHDLNISERIIFDPFIIRGLSYYTGLIFEAFYTDSEVMPSSIGAGGTYDTLFTASDLCASGLSIGVERIATIIEPEFSDIDMKYQIYISTIGENMLENRLQLSSYLRRNGFCVLMSHLENQKMRHQFDMVFDLKIPVMLILGGDEIKNETIKIKYIEKREEITVKRSELLENLNNFFNLKG